MKPYMLLLISIALVAQTPAPIITTYLAAAGSVNAGTVGTLLLDKGGAVVVTPVMTGCVLDGSDCNIADGTITYALADGTWAAIGNFTGTAHVTDGSGDYTITGSANGTNCLGQKITVQDVRYSFSFYINPDGTTTKKYTTGSITIAVG